jgi:hypothetical protein
VCRSQAVLKARAISRKAVTACGRVDEPVMGVLVLSDNRCVMSKARV